MDEPVPIRPVDTLGVPAGWRMERRTAIANLRCARCAAHVTVAQDTTEGREYVISALCPPCQDVVFAEDDEEL